MDSKMLKKKKIIFAKNYFSQKVVDTVRLRQLKKETNNNNKKNHPGKFLSNRTTQMIFLIIRLFSS